jgi:acetylornithine deacetylase/succinyl-diaminopimelate desuccinylase-like protein
MSPVAQRKNDRNKVAAAAMAAALLFCAAPSLAAQGPPRYVAGAERVVLDSALKDEDVQAALLHINEHQKEMTEMLVALAGSVAGQGLERARAGLVARRMRDIGLKEVSLEKGPTPNVIGRIKGRSRGAILFVSTLSYLPVIAHAQDGSTEHGPRADGDRITGPGTGGSAPTAAMLAAAAAIRASGVEPARDLIFAALPADDAGLQAMKRLYAAHGDSVVAVVDVQGDGKSIGCASEEQLPGMAGSPLVGTAAAIVQWLGMEPKVTSSGSASVMVATASTTPAIVLGGNSGDASGTHDEWADIPTMVRSAKQIVLLAATLR